MWAVNTLSCKLSPLAIATSTGRPFIVSAKPRKNIHYNNHEEYDEIDISPELEMLKQQEMEVLDDVSEKISGSAVLLALQKASAQKTVKKINKKKKSKNMKDKEDQGDGVVDYSNVKPLRIKSDWKVRLDELESQIQQFFS